MLFPEHLLTVRATVDAGREDEFDHWYNSEDTPDAVNLLPGCIAAARYRAVDGDGSHQYMAAYAFASQAELTAAVTGPEIKQLIRWYDESIGSFSTRTRTTYTRIFQVEK